MSHIRKRWALAFGGPGWHKCCIMTKDNRISALRADKRPAILFVCLGNICRSPLAEGVFRDAAKQAGLDVEIDSAGTGDWNVGKAPDPRAQAIARQNGIDISTLRARQVTRDDFYEYDHILAFDTSNLENLQAIKPADATAEIKLALDLVDGRAGHSVADPYFGDDAGFTICWADITAVSNALLRYLST